jgi:hypothetical protein
MTHLQTRSLPQSRRLYCVSGQSNDYFAAMKSYLDAFSTLSMRHSCNVFARSVAAKQRVLCSLSWVGRHVLHVQKFLHT